MPKTRDHVQRSTEARTDVEQLLALGTYSARNRTTDRPTGLAMRHEVDTGRAEMVRPDCPPGLHQEPSACVRFGEEKPHPGGLHRRSSI
jgi:hypothetical protein